ncbi:hypothetical protein ACJJTC_010199 [Scirpophaga incertulas]
MDNQVPFKVFLFWNDSSKPEVRRFTIDAAMVSNFDYLNNKLHCVCPGLKGAVYAVTWEDEDSDHITISSDEELMVALTSLAGNPVKLNIYVKGKNNKEDDCNIFFTAGIPTGIVSCPTMHINVVCDGCEGAVTGFRYKCTTCHDFDLCSKCEAAGMHPEHCMIRIPSPTMPRDVINIAVKKSRHFMKTIDSVVEDHGHKRNKHDKCGERKHHGGRHHHRGEGHGDRHHHVPRSGWLDTFATYMNEFANLAGDIGLDKDDNKSTKPTSQENKPDQVTTTSDSAQTLSNQPQPHNSEMPKCPFVSRNINIEQSSTNVNTTDAPSKQTEGANRDQCPLLPGMENIPKLIEMFLNGSLTPYIQQFAQQSQSRQDTEQATASSAASTTCNDVEMMHSDVQPNQADNLSVPSQSLPSASEDPVRDVSPDKMEGWTMINKEKDLLDTLDKAPQSTPIGINLPMEFQQRVSVNNAENLYPALNAATAVLNPKEPERGLQEPLKPKPAPIPAQPQPSAPQPEKTSQLPTEPPNQKLHPKPHINAALKHMLAMGFTNEEGWLTQLLESVDGNIAAVMDLLTPVTPK